MAAPKALLGRKIGMTRVFADTGEQTPVTVIEAGPCYVVQRKRRETDGYEAVQLGFDAYPETAADAETGGRQGRGRSHNRARGKANRPRSGHCAAAEVPPLRRLAEFRVDADCPLQAGDKVLPSAFAVGDRVKISGVSKGRGFQGVIRRHGYHGQRASHGSKIHRVPATAGATGPSRVLKGKGMPGQLGNRQVCVRGLTVVGIDQQRNLLLVRGGVPGPSGGYLRIEGDG